MLERAFVTSSGVSLNVAAGPPAGSPVVLLHGVTRRWQDWLLVVPYLAPRWQVYALDLRGHGRSQRTPNAYSISDYVPDLVEFVQRGLTQPAYLFGHSLGANIAAAVAAEMPDRVCGLVLEDPPLEMAGPRLEETYFLDLFHLLRRYAGSDRPAQEIAAQLADARVSVPGQQELVRLGDVRDALSLRVSAEGLKQVDPEVLEPAIAGRWLEGSDVRGVLKRISCPTLLLQADFAAGGLLPDRDAAEMAGLIADCVHLKLPGIPHNMHATATEAVMRQVVPFLGAFE